MLVCFGRFCSCFVLAQVHSLIQLSSVKCFSFFQGPFVACCCFFFWCAWHCLGAWQFQMKNMGWLQIAQNYIRQVMLFLVISTMIATTNCHCIFSGFFQSKNNSWKIDQKSSLQTAIVFFFWHLTGLPKLDCYILHPFNVTRYYKILGFRGFIVGAKA